MKFEKLYAINPRKSTDRGGYACMPLADRISNPRADWILRTCPECGRKCYETPLLKYVLVLGAKALCTDCAIRK